MEDAVQGRHAGGHLPAVFLAAQAAKTLPRHLRLDPARADRVDRDPARRELEGEGAGQADHAVLGGAVGREARDPESAEDRRKVDDPAAIRQMGGGLPNHPEDRGQVGREDRVPESVVGIVEGGSPAEPGVVDQDVDAPPPLDRRTDRALDGTGVRHVAGEGQGVLALGPHLDGVALARRVIARGQRHPRAFHAEPPGDRLADPARGARDEGHLVRKPGLCHARIPGTTNGSAAWPSGPGRGARRPPREAAGSAHPPRR